ncbi:MAG: 1-acyl-sn-glycerol-3-phosphate acyltransferase [Chromatiales bacterium]|nr:1-acyl-sn-glycerol-3-phosphate acyltransferase [Chromatiales bacterium]
MNTHAAQRLWRRFCVFIVRVFYRRFEVHGLEHLPLQGPVVLCANHASALADGLVVQAAVARPVHPIARSGLFRNPLLRPFLALVQAVPVERAQDAGSDPSRNLASFDRCFEMLARDAVLLIFPEGQSHGDPRLRDLKTGAARIALGARARNATAPAVVPLGLTFAGLGEFRPTISVELGPPLVLPAGDERDPQAVHALTDAIAEALAAVTVNAESWEQRDFAARLERFFTRRAGRYRRAALARRYRVQRRLIGALRLLEQRAPRRLAQARDELVRFQQRCAWLGLNDYQLDLRYDSASVRRFVLHTLFVVLVLVPVAAWGALNSALPFLLTRWASRRIARSDDQYDSARIATGFAAYGAFWGVQTWLVTRGFGAGWGIAYAATLLPATIAAAAVVRARRRIVDNVRVFFLFWRQRGLRGALRRERGAVERQIAALARLARRLDRAPGT